MSQPPVPPPDPKSPKDAFWHLIKTYQSGILAIIGLSTNLTSQLAGFKGTILVGVATIVTTVINWYFGYLQVKSPSSSKGLASHFPSTLTLKKPRSKTIVSAIVTSIFLAIISFVSIFGSLSYIPYERSLCQPTPQFAIWQAFSDYYNDHNYNTYNALRLKTEDGISAQQIDHQCVGISDGASHLDTPQSSYLGFSDSGSMDDAARAYRTGNINVANDDWQRAASEGLQSGVTTEYDVEPLIYLADQRVLFKPQQNYYDIIVVTMLSGSDEAMEIGRNELRGFYEALKVHNYNTPYPSIRFLVANVGSLSEYASQVQRQIQTLAKNDRHLIGILGWPVSGGGTTVITAIKDLEQTGLPIISPTATADELSQLNSYFFRMAPKNESQALADVSLVEKVYQSMLEDSTLKKKLLARKSPGQLSHIRVVVLTENRSPYSSSLATDFNDAVSNASALGLHFDNPIDILPHQVYDNFDQDSITPEQVNEIARQKPDIIYMPGYSQDAQTMMQDLQRSDPTKSIKLVGGDGFTYVRNYPDSGYPTEIANNRLYYTSFASPITDCSNSQTANDFYNAYYDDFRECPANDAILAHDAALTMFDAIQSLRPEASIEAVRNDLWNKLKQMDSLHPLSDQNMVGASTVTFDNGDRVDDIIKAFQVKNDRIYSF